MADPIRQDGDGITFVIRVAPRASRERIGPLRGDRIKVQVNAPPVDGAANEAVRALLARALGVPRASVAIVRGETGRNKTIRVRGVSREQLLAAIDA